MKTFVLFMTVGLLNGLVGGRSCPKRCASAEPRCPLGFRCQNERCIACPEGTTGPNYDCNLCSYGNPLADIFCGRGGSRCPPGYSCNIDPDDAFAVCCPCPEGTTGPNYDCNVCSFGNPLANLFCGRGGSSCPPDYSCIIDPDDAFAVCCPEN